ncbi:MAG: gamma-glutamylcyclotransferase [Pseudomonadales bacterium]|nr:gamma-glutamylcyclotransferase [Pseudomonadales bacterium]
MRYFAYGSNMSIARLRQRVPSARRIGLFQLESHDLRFHKRSTDGSAKCDAFETGNPGDCVLGALFEIDIVERRVLDLAEGLGRGYDAKQVAVVADSGASLEAMTYCATSIDSSLRPYSWYLNHVIVGARESGLPAWYIAGIEATESIEDPDIGRDRKERAIHA